MIKPLHRFGGFIADLPTPFDSEDKIDWAAFKMLCEHQIRSGATAIVVGETMGEASTLSPEEHGEIIAAAVRISRGRIAVIGGAGSNSTSRAIEATARAEAGGADAVMSVVPYYNKPMQAGILAHFQAIAASTALPIILHDVPSRTAREMTDETIQRLSESNQFVGLNDSNGSIARLFRLRSMLPRGFRLFCGNDIHAMTYLASGGDGCISAMANLFPDLCRRIYDGCTMGNLQVASGLAARLADTSALLGSDSPVATLKYGMSTLGFMRPAVRLPLIELAADVRKSVTLAMTSPIEDDQLERSETFLRVARRSYAR
jgi:4-hydroxy-tetrahydrodipicolinate synthase